MKIRNSCMPAHGKRSGKAAYPSYFQSASDWRMISSNCSLVGPLPKVNVAVRCFQSSSERP